MSARALQLKEEGNKHFQTGEYIGAESLYSKAIIADPRNPHLFTNRALARMKLDMWDSVVADCNACIALAPENMKAFYYLAQAQLALCDYDGSLVSARRASELCAYTGDRSLSAVTNLVLDCRRARWGDRERRRVRQEQDLENEMMDLLGKGRDAALGALGAEAEGDGDVQRKEMAAEWDEKAAGLKRVFERARATADRDRKVPDWATDDITFDIMIDPVVTKTGRSYERASILEHVRRHQTDPLTRERLTADDLRPNLGLRQACEEFLEQNGWAVEW